MHRRRFGVRCSTWPSRAFRSNERRLPRPVRMFRYSPPTPPISECRDSCFSFASCNSSECDCIADPLSGGSYFDTGTCTSSDPSNVRSTRAIATRHMCHAHTAVNRVVSSTNQPRTNLACSYRRIRECDSEVEMKCTLGSGRNNTKWQI